jgi:hypothetical protein
MLLSALVLVSVNGKHDGLQERLDLGHGHEAAEVRNVSGLRLQEEQQVSVSLRLVVIGKGALLHLGGILEMACDFVLLLLSEEQRRGSRKTYLLEGHAVLDQEGNSRVEIANVLFEDKVLFGLRRDLCFEFAQDLLGCKWSAGRRIGAIDRPTYPWRGHRQ